MADIAIYESPGGIIEVRLERETVWLSQAQLSELFGRERSVITKHLRNLFEDGELEEKSNVQNLHIAGSDKPVRLYNLDVVISVGYRVKSREGVRFRHWATQLLKEHLTRGYTLNRQRFEVNARELETALSLVRKAAGGEALTTDQGRGLVEQFFVSDKLVIPSLFHQDPLRKRILLSLNIDVIVQHLLRFVQEQNTERLEPVFDEESPIGSTQAMRTWYTTKPSQPTRRSQISHVMVDSTWEQYAANVLEKSGHVLAYAKNDHLGFQIYYLWNGARRRFIPDFLIRLANGKILVLEIKGEDFGQNRSKRAALDAWVTGVNAKGGFGVWCWDVAFQPEQIHDLLEKHV